MPRPVNDIVLVRPQRIEQRTPGGILLPDSMCTTSHRATVLAIGPGVSDPDAPVSRRTPPDCRVNDVVILARHFGIQDEHEHAGEKFETVRFAEVLAVVEPDPPAEVPPPGVTRVSTPAPPDDEEVNLGQWPPGGPVTQG